MVIETSLYRFQSTPLREGRRTNHPGYVVVHQVSIHAPARGATQCYAYAWMVRYVSIHAPARGATPPKSIIMIAGMFQSTPLREGRPCSS